MRSSGTIVSLVPAATEIACALGFRERLAGVSHECDHPDDVRMLPVLTNAKLEVDVERLRAIAPEVVVFQDLCNVCAVSRDKLQDLELDATLVSLTGHSLAGVEEDFMRVATALGAVDRGLKLIQSFRSQLEKIIPAEIKRRVVCIEWLDPPMVSGGWTPELVRLAGGEPLIVTESKRFEVVTWKTIEDANPELLIIFPCGFDLERTKKALTVPKISEALAPFKDRIRLADGNAFFNRPGPRLADSAQILADFFRT